VLNILFAVLLLSALPSELEELVKLALKNNPAILEEKAKLLSAKQEKNIAISMFFPRIEVSYVRTHLSDAPEYSVSPFGSFSIFERNFSTVSLKINQVIFSGTARFFNKSSREFMFLSQKYALEELKSALKFQVRVHYLQALKAKYLVDAYEKVLEEAKRHYEDVKAFYEQGIATKRELLEAEVGVEKAESELEEAKYYFTVSLETLKKDINFKDLNVSFPSALEFKEVPIQSVGELVKLALENRNSLKALKYLLKGLKMQEKIAVSKFLPRVVLSAGREITDKYSDSFTNNFVSLSVSFSVFEGGRRFFEVEKAKLKTVEVEKKLEEEKNKVKLEVIKSFRKLESAKKRVFWAKKFVESAKELLRTSRERYKERVGTSTDVVSAVAYLEKAKSLYYSAVADYIIALAELEYATGTNLGWDRNFNF